MQPPPMTMSAPPKGPPPPVQPPLSNFGRPVVYNPHGQNQKQYNKPPYQLQHYDPVWQNQQGYEEYGMQDLSWKEKAILIAIDVIPIALGIAIIVALLQFFNVQLPFFRSFNDEFDSLKRSIEEMDVVTMFNTVQMAIDKYEQLFGDETVRSFK